VKGLRRKKGERRERQSHYYMQRGSEGGLPITGHKWGLGERGKESTISIKCAGGWPKKSARGSAKANKKRGFIVSCALRTGGRKKRCWIGNRGGAQLLREAGTMKAHRTSFQTNSIKKERTYAGRLRIKILPSETTPNHEKKTAGWDQREEESGELRIAIKTGASIEV